MRRFWSVTLSRRMVGPGLVGLGLLGYGVLLPTAWVHADSAPYRTSVEGASPAPVALVLGAAAWGDRPSPFLAGRLDVAARLYREGKVKVLLVSGDNSRRDYDEPTVMYDYLRSQGIPGDRIVRDYAGFDTWDSCVRAKKVFGVDRAIVVTQTFHLPRAVALCRSAGVRAQGVGHDTMKDFATTTRYGYVREGLASFKALTDIATERRPRFLGPREPGVHRALAPP
ncbi:vancomycin permeability regulator SanA [Thermomonospora umbrina]|uniref:Vancomycin permeability regulator SanA n=1 Tax=Thermomonospora umbrina TaxID=111806 RepID=A0A3D9SLZ4_9ACTN|nr:vancomycin permeability regulator SanA [Thermomonospora umbrina]